MKMHRARGKRVTAIYFVLCPTLCTRWEKHLPRKHNNLPEERRRRWMIHNHLEEKREKRIERKWHCCHQWQDNKIRVSHHSSAIQSTSISASVLDCKFHLLFPPCHIPFLHCLLSLQEQKLGCCLYYIGSIRFIVYKIYLILK